MLYFCDYSATVAAECLDDRRIAESIPHAIGVLSEASSILGLPRFQEPIIPTDEARWAAGTAANWVWLYHYIVSLFDESAYREKRQHEMKSILRHIGMNRQYFPTECKRREKAFPNFTTVSHRSNVVAYRLYLIQQWRREQPKPVWSYRGLPIW